MKWIVAAAALFLLGAILYSMFQQTTHRYEVCVSYRSRSHCATAAGSTAQEAIASAQQIGCSLITSGRDDNMACLAAAPSSVRKLSK